VLWPWIVFALVVVYLVFDLLVIHPALVRRSRAAMAANDGRRTVSWWIAVAFIFAVAVIVPLTHQG